MNRWKTIRILDESTPTTTLEASVFLDNAFWHLRNTGAQDWAAIEARKIISDAAFSISISEVAA